jgi:predicted MPP superfamily phosphohydrolase
MSLLRVLLESAGAAMLAGAVLVWMYNRYLPDLRESWLKKLAALATLPAAVLAGVLHGVALERGWPVVSWVAWLGWLVPLAKWPRWAAVRRAAPRVRRRRLSRRGAGINWARYHPLVRVALWLLGPINSAGTLYRSTATFRVPGLASGQRVRVIFLTDFHVHPTLAPAHYRLAIQSALDRRPDVIILGGDFVSRRWMLAEADRLLAPLAAHPAVYFVRGNHDFWTRPSYMARRLAARGARLLSNDVAIVEVRGIRLALVGIEAPYIPMTRRTAESLRGRLAREAFGIPRLGIVHTPAAYRHAASLGCHIAVAGHTHGGQIRLPFFGTTIASVNLPEPLTFGIGAVGPMETWTSTGIGAFYPMRILCPPEINELTLVGAD